MRLALAMIVKPTDKEAELLSRCLSFVAPHVDDIFLTITGKNKAVEDVGKLYRAKVSHFEWVNDFAAARNFNFSQVPKEYDYILWLDADDVVRGAEKLRDVLEKNKGVDAFSMNYLYAFDEYKQPIVVHLKTRVLKNDGCVEWVGKLHEDFKSNREVDRQFIKGIEVLHLTDEVRAKENAQRNVLISKLQKEEEPNDPRSYWNYANSLKGAGHNEESLKAFDEFLKASRSDDEKYIARLRRAEIMWEIGKKEEAIEEARYALGTKPEYPDAYHLLGSLFLESQRYYEAKDMYLQGLVKPPPFYSIIVFNPLDYNYTPLMNLAKVYLLIHQPLSALTCLEGCLKINPKDPRIPGLIKKMRKEAKKSEAIMAKVSELKKIESKEQLRAKIDALPIKERSHPAVCNLYNVNFQRTETNGKELTIFCGYTDELWNPDTARQKGIGGSEEAVIHLSQRLARLGWTVTVYANCGDREKKYGLVTWKPFWSWNVRDKQDVVILWRAPRYAEYEINCPTVFLDMHDALQPGEFNDKRINRLTGIFFKSKAHRNLYPHVPDSKALIVPNGIDPKQFTDEVERDPYLIINTSSADRSLASAIRIFEKVKAIEPKAKFKWAYGWGTFDSAHSDDPKIMAWKDEQLKRMEEIGVEEMGRMNHADVAKLYQQANIFFYPTGFFEIHCISAIKAQLAGAWPVTTDFAALNESIQFGDKYHTKLTPETWSGPYQFDFGLNDEATEKLMVQRLVNLMRHPPKEEERKKMRQWAKLYDWDNIAVTWDAKLRERTPLPVPSNVASVMMK